MRKIILTIVCIISLAACQTSPTPPPAAQLQPGSAIAFKPRQRMASASFAEPQEIGTLNTSYCRKICLDEKGAPSGRCEFLLPNPTSDNAKSDDQSVRYKTAWRIRPLSGVEDLISRTDHHYEIALMNLDHKLPVSPGTKTEELDRFTLARIGSQLFLTQDRGDPYNPVFVSSARLALRPHNPPHLWAEGYAYADAGGTEPIGIFRLFGLQDRKGDEPCRHSHYSWEQKSGQPQCRSLLFEFYDTNDPVNALNAPIFGRNVVAITGSETCAGSRPVADRKPLETSDGEGDEGPNKPR